MNYKFFKDNEQIEITNVGDLIALIRKGEINDETILFDAEKLANVKVSEIEELNNISPEDAQRYLSQNIYQNRAENFLSNAYSSKSGVQVFFGILFIIIGFLTHVIFKIIQITSTGQSLKGSSINSVMLFSMPFGIVFFIGSLILGIIISRIKKANLNILVLGLIFIITSTIGTAANIDVFSMNKIAKDREYLNLASKEIIKIAEEALSGKESSGKLYSSQEYGQYAEVLNTCNDFYSKMYANNFKLEESMKNYGFEKMLSVDGLSNINNITASRENLRKFAQEMQQVQQVNDSCFNEYPKKIEALNIDSRLKQQIIKGYEESKSEYIPSLKEYYDIENACVSQTDAILQFMEERQGKYICKNNAINFYSQQDVNNFNAMLAKVKKLSNQEAEIQRKIRSKAIENLSVYKYKVKVSN